MNDNPSQPLVKIKLRRYTRAYYQNDLQFPLEYGDWVIVEADRGEDIGLVIDLDDQNAAPTTETYPRILRKAGLNDFARDSENRLREMVCLQFCQQSVRDLNLAMKIVDVDIRLDRKKVIFYFTADDRIDFRELVKVLASEYKTRIEMRQISSREEMKRELSIGPCGLALCCSRFLEDFDPVSTQLVKQQNLPMNPAKISGCCGKLKCCYKYEHEFYEEFLSHYPPYGSKVSIEQKTGTVEKIDIFQKTMTVRYEDNQLEDLPLADFNRKIKVIS